MAWQSFNVYKSTNQNPVSYYIIQNRAFTAFYKFIAFYMYTFVSDIQTHHRHRDIIKITDTEKT